MLVKCLIPGKVKSQGSFLAKLCKGRLEMKSPTFVSSSVGMDSNVTSL